MRKLLFVFVVVALIFSNISYIFALTEKPGEVSFVYISIIDHLTGECLFIDDDVSENLINVSGAFIESGKHVDIYIVVEPNLKIDHMCLRMGIGNNPSIIKDSMTIDLGLDIADVLYNGNEVYTYCDYTMPECYYLKFFAYAKVKFNPLHPENNDKIETLGVANTRPIKCREDLYPPLGHIVSVNDITSNSAIAEFMLDEIGNSGEVYSWINVYENKERIYKGIGKRNITWRVQQYLTIPVTGLESNTEYVFEIVFVNNAGTIACLYQPFITKKILPEIRTLESFDYSYTDIGSEDSYIALKGIIDLVNDYKVSKIGFYAIDRNIHEEYTRFEIEGIQEISNSKEFELRIPIYRESTYMWKFYIIVDDIEIVADNEEYIFIQSKNKPRITMDRIVSGENFVDIYGTVVDDGIPGARITPYLKWGECFPTKLGESWNGWNNDGFAFFANPYITYADKSYAKGEGFIIRITDKDGLLENKGMSKNGLSVELLHELGIYPGFGYRCRLEARNMYGIGVSRWDLFSTHKTQRKSIVELGVARSDNMYTKGDVEAIEVSVIFTGFTDSITISLDITEIGDSRFTKNVLVAEGSVSNVFSQLKEKNGSPVYVSNDQSQFSGTKIPFRVPLSIFPKSGKFRVQAICVNAMQKGNNTRSLSESIVVDILDQRKGTAPYIKLELIPNTITTNGVSVKATVLDYGQASDITIEYCIWYSHMPWNTRRDGLKSYPRVGNEWTVDIDEHGMYPTQTFVISGRGSGKKFAVFAIASNSLGYQYISPAHFFMTLPKENTIVRPVFENTKPHAISFSKVEFSVIPKYLYSRKTDMYITCKMSDSSVREYAKIYGATPADIISLKKSNVQTIGREYNGKNVYLFIDGLVHGMMYNYTIHAVEANEPNNEFGRMCISISRFNFSFKTKMLLPMLIKPSVMVLKSNRVLLDINFTELGSTGYAEYNIVYQEIGSPFIFETGWQRVDEWNMHQSYELTEGIRPDTRYKFIVQIRNGTIRLGTQDKNAYIYKPIIPYGNIYFTTPKEE